MENVDRQTDGQKSMFFLYYIDISLNLSVSLRRMKCVELLQHYKKKVTFRNLFQLLMVAIFHSKHLLMPK